MFYVCEKHQCAKKENEVDNRETSLRDGEEGALQSPIPFVLEVQLHPTL